MNGHADDGRRLMAGIRKALAKLLQDGFVPLEQGSLVNDRGDRLQVG